MLAPSAWTVAARHVFRSTVRHRIVAAASTSYLIPTVSSRQRSFSVSHYRLQPTQKYTASSVSDGQYQKLSNDLLDTLTEQFETLLEEADPSSLEATPSSASEWDIECASGVLNLRCGSHGTYVVNKQPPNKQVWLSSPKSGPKRFDYDAEQRTWFCHKDGKLHTLKQILDSELNHVFAVPVDLPISD